MKFITAACLVLAASFSSAEAACSDTMEYNIGSATKLAFTGFDPMVKRMTNTGMGSKIVLRGYGREPKIEMIGNTITVMAGDPCDGDVSVETPSDPVDEETTDAPTEEDPVVGSDGASAAMSLFKFSLPIFMGRGLGVTTGLGSALLTTLAVASSNSFMVEAQTVSECEVVPIEVDIYVDATVNEIVMRQAQSGDFEVCPPESLYWKHHPKVFGGYEGCVGEKTYFPCAQDSQGIWEEDGALYAQYPVNWDGESCVDTGYDTESRTYWILWGDPLDKYELNSRTGLNPVVTFPFNRGPYPRYEQGVPIDEAYDDSLDAQAAAKDFLVYIGAFTEEELDEFDVTFTEGAESGMTHLWAGKALEIARTTCNRDIYALMEVPAYGYSPSDAASIVNKFASSFYNGTECLCAADDSCLDPTVTISNRGWLPLTPFPMEMGGDGLMYAADSASPSSPWMESMVFPENPSGKIKTPQLDSNRRVCDGVYVWPMYFGMRDYKIPMDERPDCSAWSFSITKAYSASVRAGFVLTKKEPASNKESMIDAVSDSFSMTNGLFSEWSWYGQMQLWDMIMSRPLDDPTSWIGAYSEIMEEKWALVIDGFADCPVTTVSNPRAGAYAFFVYNPPYTGVQTGFVSSFFRDVLGIRTTTYNWGFRGADPADFYGANYTTADFTRLQLYRDVSVYQEVARRAKIVCADPDASVGNFISVNQWVAGQGTTSRRLNEGYADREERKRHLVEVMPDLTERQLEYLAASHEDSDEMDKQAASCAPDFTTTCLFNAVGQRFEDF